VQEDYLRILRFFRFHAWYGNGELDKDALAACKQYAPQLATLSGERIAQEMLKLLAAPAPFPSLDSMQHTGVLAHIIDAPDIAAVEKLLAFEAEAKIVPHPELRLAALIHEADIAARWKLSNALAKKLERLLAAKRRIHSGITLAEQKKLLRRVGAEIYAGAVALASGPAALLALPYEWQPPEFPVSGDDLKALGFAEGKRLGECLRQLEEAWEASDYALTKAQLLERAKAL
jgi:poly(A) polymerase